MPPFRTPPNEPRMSPSTREEALRRLRRAHHHEIRGALNALRLQVTLLQRGREKTTPDDPRFAQWVDGTATEAGAVERALEELSAVERVGEVVKSGDPAAIAERVARLLEPLAKTRQAHVEVEPTTDDTAVSLPSPGRLASRLLAHGAAALAAAATGETVTFRIGADEIEISPGSVRLPL